MALAVGDLIATLRADVSQFMTGFQQAEQKLLGFGVASVALGNVVNDVARKATEMAKNLAMVPWDSAKDAAHYAEELKNVAAITSLSTKTIQEWDVALNRAGLGANDLSVMMNRLSQNITDAKDGVGAAIKNFNQMNITVGEMDTVEDVFRKIAQSAEDMGDSERRTSAMTDLLGKGVTRMIPLFKDGTKAFDDSAKAANDMAAVMDERTIRALAKTSDSFADLDKSLKAFWNNTGALFAPAITIMVDGLTSVVSAASRAVNALTGFFQKLAEPIAINWGGFADIGAWLQKNVRGPLSSAGGGSSVAGGGWAAGIGGAQAVAGPSGFGGVALPVNISTQSAPRKPRNVGESQAQYERRLDFEKEMWEIESEFRVGEMIRARDTDLDARGLVYSDRTKQRLVGPGIYDAGEIREYNRAYRDLVTPTTRRTLDWNTLPATSQMAIGPGLNYDESLMNFQPLGISQLRGQYQAGLTSLAPTAGDTIPAFQLLAKHLEELRTRGFEPTTEDVKALYAQLNELTTGAVQPSTAAADELSHKTHVALQAQGEYQTSLDAITHKEYLLGREYDGTADRISTTIQRMETLRQEHKETDSEYQNLAATLDRLKDQKALSDVITGLFDSFREMVDGIVQGVLLGTQDIGKGLKDMGLKMATVLGKNAIEGMLKPFEKALTTFFTTSLPDMLGMTVSQLGAIGAVAGAAATGGMILSGIVDRTDFSKPRNQGALAGGLVGTILAPFGLGTIGGALLGGAFGSLFDDGSAGRLRNQGDFLNGMTGDMRTFMEGLPGRSGTPNALLRALGTFPEARGFLDSSIRGDSILSNGIGVGFRQRGDSNFGPFQGAASSTIAGFVSSLQDVVNLLIDSLRQLNEAINTTLYSLTVQIVGLRGGNLSVGGFNAIRGGFVSGAQMDLDRARLAQPTTPQELLAYSQRIRSLITQRYQGEIELVQSWSSQMQTALQAWRAVGITVAEQLDVLRLNQFGAPTAQASYDFHNARFSAARNAFGMNPSATTGQAVSDLAGPLLEAAAALHGDLTGASYQAVFSTVIGALESVRDASAEAEVTFQNEMLAALGGQVDLQTLIEQNTSRMADELERLRNTVAAQAAAMGFSIPSFDVGTPYVPRDMIAKVHKGETIIPAGMRSGTSIIVQNPTFIGTDSQMLRQFAAVLSPYLDDAPSYVG